MADNRDLQASQFIIGLLDRSKQRSDEILDALPGLFAVLNEKCLIARGNDNLAEILGCSGEDLLWKDFRSVLGPEDGEKLTKAVGQILDGRQGNTKLELTIEVAGQKPMELSASLKLVQRSPAPNKSLVLLIAEDVTELKRVTTQKARMQGELQTAKAIQDALLPPFDADFGQARISGFYTPASECGGDWWHYFVKGTKLYCCIGDVTGHGVQAALLTSAGRAAMAVIERGGTVDLEEATQLMNEVVVDTAKGKQWMTFAFLELDMPTGNCRYISASHELLGHVRPKAPPEAKQVSWVSVGPTEILGWKKPSDYKSVTFKIEPGEYLFFYTDGLKEMSAVGKRNSARFLTSSLKDAGERYTDAKSFNRHIEKNLIPPEARHDLADDVTFYTLQYLGPK